uniref:Uncharacterized protein n=1 Tax=Neogoniolithon spectabile TaxID=231755 RepID=A0A3G3MH13_9FLOR|nr:hypothetical protein [Neogoniolithon spectabile]AYR06091.1 hypothetical protein [Neogoniolithon spectabile]
MNLNNKICLVSVRRQQPDRVMLHYISHTSNNLIKKHIAKVVIRSRVNYTLKNKIFQSLNQSIRDNYTREITLDNFHTIVRKLKNSGFFRRVYLSFTFIDYKFCTIIHIDTNPIIKKIQVLGFHPTIISEYKLAQIIKSQVGLPENIKLLNRIIKDISSIYHNKGYRWLRYKYILDKLNQNYIIHISPYVIDEIKFLYSDSFTLNKCLPLELHIINKLKINLGQLPNHYSIETGINELKKEKLVFSCEYSIIHLSKNRLKIILRCSIKPNSMIYIYKYNMYKVLNFIQNSCKLSRTKYIFFNFADIKYCLRQRYNIFIFYKKIVQNQFSRINLLLLGKQNSSIFLKRFHRQLTLKILRRKYKMILNSIKSTNYIDYMHTHYLLNANYFNKKVLRISLYQDTENSTRKYCMQVDRKKYTVCLPKLYKKQIKQYKFHLLDQQISNQYFRLLNRTRQSYKLYFINRYNYSTSQENPVGEMKLIDIRYLILSMFSTDYLNLKVNTRRAVMMLKNTVYIILPIYQGIRVNFFEFLKSSLYIKYQKNLFHNYGKLDVQKSIVSLISTNYFFFYANNSAYKHMGCQSQHHCNQFLLVRSLFFNYLYNCSISYHIYTYQKMKIVSSLIINYHNTNSNVFFSDSANISFNLDSYLSFDIEIIPIIKIQYRIDRNYRSRLYFCIS